MPKRKRPGGLPKDDDDWGVFWGEGEMPSVPELPPLPPDVREGALPSTPTATPPKDDDLKLPSGPPLGSPPKGDDGGKGGCPCSAELGKANEHLNKIENYFKTTGDSLTELKNYLLGEFKTAIGGGGMGGGGGGGSGGHGAYGSLGSWWQRLLGGPSTSVPPPKYVSAARGIGGYLKNIGKNIWAGSRARRHKEVGKKIGMGIGRSLGMGKGGMKMMGAAGGAVGAAATGVVVFAQAMKEAYKAVVAYTEAAMAEAKRLSEVSGSMAAVTAKREIHQMQRDIQKGEQTAGSANELMEAEHRRKEQTQRMEVAFTNFSNTLLTKFNDMITTILEPMADAVEWIAKQFDFGGKKVNPEGIGGFAPSAIPLLREAEARDRRLMEAAKTAARLGMGASAPMGATPVGGLPRP